MTTSNRVYRITTLCPSRQKSTSAPKDAKTFLVALDSLLRRAARLTTALRACRLARLYESFWLSVASLAISTDTPNMKALPNAMKMLLIAIPFAILRKKRERSDIFRSSIHAILYNTMAACRNGSKAYYVQCEMDNPQAFPHHESVPSCGLPNGAYQCWLLMLTTRHQRLDTFLLLSD